MIVAAEARAGAVGAGLAAASAELLAGPATAASAASHCAVTGPGFLLTAALGFAAALAPGPALSWYRTGTEAVIFLVILAAGYGLEHAVAARTGRRVLR